MGTPHLWIVAIPLWARSPRPGLPHSRSVRGVFLPGTMVIAVCQVHGHGDCCRALVGDSGPGERESIVSVLDPRQNQCQRPQHHWHGHLVLGEIIGAVPGKESWYRSEAALHQFKFPANDGRIVIPRSLRKINGYASGPATSQPCFRTASKSKTEISVSSPKRSVRVTVYLAFPPP